jgi:hypothetical protein
MLRLPFFDELEKSKNILLAGAGGGFDIFSGLPLYFGLRAAGKNVHLANLSFSFLPPPQITGEKRLSPSVAKVTPSTPIYTDYFPEFFLSKWFKNQGEDVPIYCFEKTGVIPLKDSYQALIDHLDLDAIILVDGGTDSLMRGDEIGLGTPHEDITSILAVNEMKGVQKMLACLGFGVDAFHGVCHAHFLEAVSELIRSNGYLGMFSLTEDMPEVQGYRKASEYTFDAMPHNISIVTSSILSALAGRYGNHQSTPRTQNSELWINPLMSVYWCFRLEAVAQRILYKEEMMSTRDFGEVLGVLKEFRSSLKNIRPRKEIPV